MTECLLALLGGVLGSAHCIGMCGAFVVTLGVRGRPAKSPFINQLTYALGRVFTYACLGTVAGGLGQQLAHSFAQWSFVRLILDVAAGATLFAVALHSMGWMPRWKSAAQSCLGPKLFADVYNQSLSTHVFLAGMINGFLPCGLLYAYLSAAAASGQALAGGVIMACFGLGTIPALTALGLGANRLSCHHRRLLMRCAAFIMIVLALWFVHRSFIQWISPSQEPAECPMCTSS